MKKGITHFLCVLLPCLLCNSVLAERLDDRLSPQQELNFQLNWQARNRFDLSDEQLNALVAQSNPIETRLDTSAYVGQNARIFLQLPVDIQGLKSLQGLRMSWTTRGRFADGSVTPGGRSLLFEGTITEAVMTDFFSYRFELDSRSMLHDLRFEPVYDIEIQKP